MRMSEGKAATDARHSISWAAERFEYHDRNGRKRDETIRDTPAREFTPDLHEHSNARNPLEFSQFRYLTWSECCTLARDKKCGLRRLTFLRLCLSTSTQVNVDLSWRLNASYRLISFVSSRFLVTNWNCFEIWCRRNFLARQGFICIR